MGLYNLDVYISKMTKYYEKVSTRFYTFELVKAWAKGEEELGLMNSLFVMDNGKVTQYVDSEEGEKFHEELKRDLKTDGFFDKVCEQFFEAIDKKDKLTMFYCLAIFNEIDNYPEIANETILRRLKRVRETTQDEIYKLR